MGFLSTVYIAPFIKGTAIVLTEMLGLTVTRGEPEVEGDLFESYGFTAIVGFTGGWRGRFLLDMSPATAIALAYHGEDYCQEEVLLCEPESSRSCYRYQQQPARYEHTSDSAQCFHWRRIEHVQHTP